MTAPDLLPTLQRVAGLARDLDATARKPDASPAAGAEAILAELTGAGPDYQWRNAVGPDAAAVVCLAKSVRVLAAMLAAGEGVTLSIAGILDDLSGEAPADPRAASGERFCLGCGVYFRSLSAANRLCDQCAPAALVTDDTPGGTLSPR